MLVIWSDTLDTIIPRCFDFDDKLIKLLWRSRPNAHTSNAAASVSRHIGAQGATSAADGINQSLGIATTSTRTSMDLRDVEKSADRPEVQWKRTWYGRKVRVTIVEDGPERRPTRLFAAVYNGIAAGLAFCESKSVLSL